MKKKQTPWLFIIPAVALCIAVGVATAIKLLSPENAMPVDAAPKEYPNPYGKTDEKRPSTFLGKLVGPSVATQPATPVQTQQEISSYSSSLDMNRALKDTVDDGGSSDLDALKEDISGL